MLACCWQRPLPKDPHASHSAPLPATSEHGVEQSIWQPSHGIKGLRHPHMANLRRHPPLEKLPLLPGKGAGPGNVVREHLSSGVEAPHNSSQSAWARAPETADEERERAIVERGLAALDNAREDALTTITSTSTHSNNHSLNRGVCYAMKDSL